MLQISEFISILRISRAISQWKMLPHSWYYFLSYLLICRTIFPLRVSLLVLRVIYVIHFCKCKRPWDRWLSGQWLVFRPHPIASQRHDTHIVIKTKFLSQVSLVYLPHLTRAPSAWVFVLATTECRRVRVPKWQPSVKDVRATNLVAQSRKSPKSEHIKLVPPRSCMWSMANSALRSPVLPKYDQWILMSLLKCRQFRYGFYLLVMLLYIWFRVIKLFNETCVDLSEWYYNFKNVC